MLAEVGSLSKVIADAAKGNLAAQYFLQSIYHAIGVWDDLIDKDTPVPDRDINTAFEFFMIHLPQNPWYAVNFALLQPVMQAFIINWHSGNVQKKEHPEQTYMLRQMFFDLVTQVAAIQGGLEFAKKINLRLWQETAAFMTLQEYKEKDNGLAA